MTVRGVRDVLETGIADADIVPENLDSIKTIVAYVEGKLAKAAA